MSKKQRKPRAVWLSCSFSANWYHLWPSKSAYMQARDHIAGFCAEHFERVTGYRLEPGECKRVMIRVEEAKP